MKCGIEEAADFREGSVVSWKIRGIGEAGDVGITRRVQRQVKNAIVCAATDISEINERGSVVRELGHKAITIEFPAIAVSVSACEGERPFSREGFARNIDETARIDFHR